MNTSLRKILGPMEWYPLGEELLSPEVSEDEGVAVSSKAATKE